jgi:hypothetical protein
MKPELKLPLRPGAERGIACSFVGNVTEPRALKKHYRGGNSVSERFNAFYGVQPSPGLRSLRSDAGPGPHLTAAPRGSCS